MLHRPFQPAGRTQEAQAQENWNNFPPCTIASVNSNIPTMLDGVFLCICVNCAVFGAIALNVIILHMVNAFVFFMQLLMHLHTRCKTLGNQIGIIGTSTSMFKLHISIVFWGSILVTGDNNITAGAIQDRWFIPWTTQDALVTGVFMLRVASEFIKDDELMLLGGAADWNLMFSFFAKIVLNWSGNCFLYHHHQGIVERGSVQIMAFRSLNNNNN
ncbi:hypothetical protein ACJX0J_021869 [Zea mays]